MSGITFKKSAVLRGLTYSLGVFWLLDAILQFQPGMFTSGFVSAVLAPNLQNQPGTIRDIVAFGIRAFGARSFLVQSRRGAHPASHRGASAPQPAGQISALRALAFRPVGAHRLDLWGRIRKSRDRIRDNSIPALPDRRSSISSSPSCFSTPTSILHFPKNFP